MNRYQKLCMKQAKRFLKIAKENSLNKKCDKDDIFNVMYEDCTNIKPYRFYKANLLLNKYMTLDEIKERL